MTFSKALIVSILATMFVASSVVAVGQTFARQPSSARAVSSASQERKAAGAESEPAEARAAAEQPVERSIAALPDVAVKVCVASGSITVHGWDRKEVRARSSEVAEIEFQHEGEPARKIQLLIADKAQGPGRTSSCLSFSDVEMDVPRGATVQLQTRDGDIKVADVATAYVNTQNGDVSIERAGIAVDAGTIGGVISLKDSSGRVSLHSVGGNIEVSGVRPSEASDIFDASSVGGDITLTQVAHARLNARSLNGGLNMIGALAHDGHYAFKTISGDVTLTLPANSSFKLSAKLSKSAEIITDFPITPANYASAPDHPSPRSSTAPAPRTADLPSPGTPAPATAPGAPAVDPVSPAPPVEPQADPFKLVAKIKTPTLPRLAVEVYALHRLEGVCGSGDALIDIGSFSGTVHLKKQ